MIEMGYVYLLKCWNADPNDYIMYPGKTKNLEERIKAYCNGKGSKITNKYQNHELIHFWDFPNITKEELLREESKLCFLTNEERIKFVKKIFNNFSMFFSNIDEIFEKVFGSNYFEFVKQRIKQPTTKRNTNLTFQKKQILKKKFKAKNIKYLYMLKCWNEDPNNFFIYAGRVINLQKIRYGNKSYEYKNHELIWFLEYPNIDKKELHRLEHGLLGLTQEERLKLIHEKDKPYFKQINDLFFVKLYKDYDWLYEQIITLHKTPKQVAKEFNYYLANIIKQLKKFGINPEKLYQNYDWLYQKYVIEEYSKQEIAEMCGVSVTTIQKWLRKYGIQPEKLYKDYNWLYKQRITLGKTPKQIAKMCNCNVETIRNWLRKFDIQPEKLYMNYDWMYQKYIIEKLSMTKMAKITECSVETIRRWLIKLGIKKGSIKEACNIEEYKQKMNKINQKNNAKNYLKK